jgi:hypothetical protein
LIISHTSSLAIFKGFGVLLLLTYILIVSGDPDLTTNFSGGNIVFHLVTLLISITLITLTWVMKFSFGKLESVSGCILFKKRKEFTDLVSLEFYAEAAVAQNGPSSFGLNLGIKVRSQPKTIVLYSGLSDEKAQLFASYGKQVLAATGDLPVNISERFSDIYKQKFGKDFTF